MYRIPKLEGETNGESTKAVNEMVFVKIDANIFTT